MGGAGVGVGVGVGVGLGVGAGVGVGVGLGLGVGVGLGLGVGVGDGLGVGVGDGLGVGDVFDCARAFELSRTMSSRGRERICYTSPFGVRIRRPTARDFRSLIESLLRDQMCPVGSLNLASPVPVTSDTLFSDTCQVCVRDIL